VFRSTDALGEFRNLATSFVQTQGRVTRDDGSTYFFRPHGRPIDLAAPAPSQLHEAGPGRDAVVTAEGEPLFFMPMMVEAGPAPDARTAAVGSDNPARREDFAFHHHAIFVHPGHDGAPKKADAGVLGAFILFFATDTIDAVLPIGCYPLLLQVPALVFLGIWIVLQIWQVRSQTGAVGGVGYLEHVADRAAGYGMPGVRVDGNDPLAVVAALDEALGRARRGAPRPRGAETRSGSCIERRAGLGRAGGSRLPPGRQLRTCRRYRRELSVRVSAVYVAMGSTSDVTRGLYWNRNTGNFDSSAVVWWR